MTRGISCLLFLTAVTLAAQQNPSVAEQQSLQQALGEAGNSPIDVIHAIEDHLKQYPNAPNRPQLEAALAKTAIDMKDDARTVLYGSKELEREPDNIQLLERVMPALLRKGDQASAAQALQYARHYDQLIQAAFKSDKLVPAVGAAAVKRKDDYDRAVASARLLQARAQGLLGHGEEAIQLAKSSYEVFPSVEAAREAARWLSAAGKDRDAIQYLADAFTIAGLRSAEPDGASDRARMSELYRKLNGSEAGLGDLILKAYDDTSNLMAARRTEFREFDPNSQLKDPMQFTLSASDGGKLKLASLQGKVVVMDFWATWCIPCRTQHPLYDQVKAKYGDSGDVVFLAVDSDEDKSIVKPFMQSQNWTQTTYFEDGLAQLLQVSDIPTTIIFGKSGAVTSRMIGFIPERFVDMLTDRIDEALGKPARAKSGAAQPNQVQPTKLPSAPLPPPLSQ